MKACFDRDEVPHSPWCARVEDTQECREELSLLKFPLLCKPDPSYDCCGITEKSLVWNPGEAITVAEQVHLQGFSRVYAEEFITGREFTCFVFGDSDYGLETSLAIERVFDAKLPKLEQFMKHDPLGCAQPRIVIAEDDVQQKCRECARRAYMAVEGSGYGRVDMRMEEHTAIIKVLEVNAACGLGADPETCLFGLFLHHTNASYAEYAAKFLMHGLYRRNASAALAENRSQSQAQSQSQARPVTRQLRVLA